MTSQQEAIFTIGHSTHTYERLLSLLRSVGITAIADVRTSPYSRHFPQFNKEQLSTELRLDGVAYSFLGKELGGRPKGRQHYSDGVADYERMAKAPDFQHGIQRVLEGARKFRVALMCSEHDPLDCHRCLLVGRVLAERGVSVKHIHSDGGIIGHDEVEERLLKLEGQQGDDLFISRSERLAIAYQRRARKIAYAEQTSDPSDPVVAE
jgi:uncharacterized protein (DUF488 family)